MNYTITLNDIAWDTEVDGMIEDVDLPTAYTIDVPDVDEPEDAIDEAVDRVTDLFGYCILGIGDIQCDESITT